MAKDNMKDYIQIGANRWCHKDLWKKIGDEIFNSETDKEEIVVKDKEHNLGVD